MAEYPTMDLQGRNIVVTGAGSGIGRALVRRFAKDAPNGVVAVDIAAGAVAAVAEETGALGIAADVGREDEILRVIAEAEDAYGPIDLFCSNAGLAGPVQGPEAPDEDWQRLWNVNVMAHVWAARALVPSMLDRGEGYLFSTVSAAGMLMSLGQMPYSATKHAALSVAECLAVQYGDAGIRVSAFCPQIVDTPMFNAVIDQPIGKALRASSSPMSPDEVAEVVVEGIRDERFLILSHPEVVTYAQRRATDHDRWIGGMRRLHARSVAAAQS
jgi:NAD(P)-dependent dehydrogenase (short-subunit alcohol dehydrogenase family)